MRKKHFMGMLATGAAALLLSIVPAACTDEREENPATGGRIGFAVDLWKEGTTAQAARTKGAGTEAGGLPTDTLPAVRVIPLDGEASGDGKTLYLHAVTTDGIGAGTEGGGDAARMATTKAAPVNTATMYDEMAVTAFVYPAADSWPAAYTAGNATPYMSNVKVKKSEAWSTSYYWPGAARKISFFASAPYDCDGLMAFNEGDSGNPPYLSYTVPSAVADQKDLLVATAVDKAGNTNTAEPLTMRHALTAVRFVTGDGMLPGTVSRITLKNVYGTGRMKLEASPAWYGQGTTASFGQTLSSEAVAPDPQAPGTPLTKEAETFMMIPQTLPTGAQIEVIYRDDLTGTQRTLTANIAGKTWPMGKTVTYRISTNSIVVTPVLEVTAPEEFTYTGGAKSYAVKSYVTVTRPGDPEKKEPMPWTAEYSTDNGASWSETKPEWLTTFTASGEGSIAAKSYTSTVEPQDGVTHHPQNEALKAAPPVNDGVNDVYDLSTKGGTTLQNTANCYIVNAAGRYKLPLIYGNGVKNGVTNSSAYTPTASGNVLKPLINHAENGITSPYLKDYTITSSMKATLVWQDEQNLVTNVKLSSDYEYLEFTVDKATIQQGNAVVAVRNNSDIVIWSWHIWVTDYMPQASGDKTITNKQSKEYTIMPVNLGWCDGQTTTYAERTVQVRFKQTGTSAAPQIITVKQKEHNIVELGNNTYYQWGRKDPFVGALAGNVNKTWYDADGNMKTNQNPPVQSFGQKKQCITEGIKHPGTFYTTVGMDNYYTNLWSANNIVYTNNDNSVVKTIYDPCPVGYKMPPSNAFIGFTVTGDNTNSTSQFNVSGEFNNGWNFYCDGSNHSGDTVFFPISGWRQYSTGNPGAVATDGFCWTAVPYDTNSSWDLYFDRNNVNPKNRNHRGFSCSVRAVRE
ncbi:MULTISPECIES: fimbrillin family protein [unclassified Bacteroides]|uniref:fimbrillin family protein n=1 Tax=unclassified Bacteroides TaxID=2646097 RepID=UPI0040628C56